MLAVSIASAEEPVTPVRWQIYARAKGREFLDSRNNMAARQVIYVLGRPLSVLDGAPLRMPKTL
jgi:hypothetical protein